MKGSESKKSSWERELVTVASSMKVYEMHILRSYLEDHEMRTFMRDEQMASSGLYGLAVGGVKLEVRRRDVERAVGLIARYEREMEAQLQHGELSMRPLMEMHRLVEVSREEGAERAEEEEASLERRCAACGEGRGEEIRRYAPWQLALIALSLGMALFWLEPERRCARCRAARS